MGTRGDAGAGIDPAQEIVFWQFWWQKHGFGSLGRVPPATTGRSPRETLKKAY
jgi:hypothetical protein